MMARMGQPSSKETTSPCPRPAGSLGAAGNSRIQNGYSLRFASPEVEEAFLRGRLPKMLLNISRMSMLLSVVCMISLVARLFVLKRQNDMGWRDWLDTAMLGFFSISGPVVTVLARLQRTENWVGCRSCEYFVSAWMLLLAGWQLAKGYQGSQDCIGGQEVSADLVYGACEVAVKLGKEACFQRVVGNEAMAALSLDAVVTVSHLAFPVRWSVARWTDLAFVVGFVAFMLPGGYDAKILEFFLAIVFASLVVGASMGQRSQEISERGHFATIVDERTLRAQAEFSLHLPRGGSTQAPQDDSLSLPTTTDTGDLFKELMKNSTRASGTMSVQVLRDLGVLEHWLLREEEVGINMLKVLGRGGFGLVVEGMFCCQAVAAKICPTNKLSTTVLNELRILRQVRHPNIAIFHGACIVEMDNDGYDIKLVLEKVKGRTLSSLRSQLKDLVQSQDFRAHRQIAMGVSQALVYLHTRRPPIVHADLKPANVMVEMSGKYAYPKLLDFGLSRVVSRSSTISGGTQDFIAPEAQHAQVRAVPSADIYALGQMLYFLATGTKRQPRTPETDSAGGGALEDLGPPGGGANTLLETWRMPIDECMRQDGIRRPTAREVCEELTEAGARDPRTESKRSLSSSASGTTTTRTPERQDVVPAPVPAAATLGRRAVGL